MNEHMQVVMNCYAKFPHLRFGQFIINVTHNEARVFSGDRSSEGTLYYLNDRDLAEHCKAYCREMGV